MGDDGLIVVLLDSDDDDPEPLAEVIEAVPCRARVIAVVAVREYEAWFLAASTRSGGTPPCWTTPCSRVTLKPDAMPRDTFLPR